MLSKYKMLPFELFAIFRRILKAIHITGLLYGQTVLAAAFPAVFELSSLDETNGFSLNGVAVDDRSGISVSSGDVNGDGYADLIIGAYAAGPGERSAAGTTYVVFGEVNGWTNSLELSSLNGEHKKCGGILV